MHTEVDANERCGSLVIGNHFRIVGLAGLVRLRSPLAMTQVLLEVEVVL